MQAQTGKKVEPRRQRVDSYLQDGAGNRNGTQDWMLCVLGAVGSASALRVAFWGELWANWWRELIWT